MPAFAFGGPAANNESGGKVAASLPNFTTASTGSHCSSQSVSPLTKRIFERRPCVFISWRMAESKAETRSLEQLLMQQGLGVVVVGELPGGDLMKAVSDGMEAADLFAHYHGHTSAWQAHLWNHRHI
jgi:hypothetical protein